MRAKTTYCFGLLIAFYFGVSTTHGQSVVNLTVESGSVRSITIDRVKGSSSSPDARATGYSVVSYDVWNKSYVSSGDGPLQVSINRDETFQGGVKLVAVFSNTGKDTVTLSNVIPFGRSKDQVYITGKGAHPLSRTHLFVPGKIPVNVIVPDNAWDLGFAIRPAFDSISVYGLARRDPQSLAKAIRKRFSTTIESGGSVSYNIYIDAFSGDWRNGLRKAFNEKYLYDLTSFDNSLYQREDLKWIRKAYVMHLMMAWDLSLYNADSGKYVLDSFLERGKKLYGGDDVICIWPTWPSLGIDQRNQFDMYRDLPGGLPALRQLAESLRAKGTKFFIAYNPWDESTRKEDHLKGLGELIKQTSADGVVLDTRGSSSLELQQVADKVKPGVIMYSEGMAVPADMPGIVSGRVHNALYYPPILNLNKLIRSDFSIFRVVEVNKEPIQREYAQAFFNGYGTEVNQFAPGHPEWETEQYKFLGRTTQILRQHSDVFSGGKLTPLIHTFRDSIWVNQWEQGSKTVYTIFSNKPEGFNGNLFATDHSHYHHAVDLWNHEEAIVTEKNDRRLVNVNLSPFNATFSGTNNEGAVGCVAIFPKILDVEIHGNRVRVWRKGGATTKIFAGNPGVTERSFTTQQSVMYWNLRELFDRYEGKLVIQAIEGDQLIDEAVLHVAPGVPRLVSVKEKTEPGKTAKNMVRVPSGKFRFRTTHGDEFISYPPDDPTLELDMPSYLMDKYPVTNEEFAQFLRSTNYQPSDTSNFLKHWKKKQVPRGQEKFPVVYVSIEDARAYAAWAKKRLPTEVEWQYAGQTSARNEWPWKQIRPVTRKDQYVNETLTVKAIEGIEKNVCNLGDGKPYAVGSYPKGANPFGIHDLSGSVWQLTNDVYETGSYRYIMMKGGSYFKPSSSWWYVQGGPRELHYRQYLLRVSPGFERNATVGFRCVKDMP